MLARIATALQILATCLLGLMAGFFFAFSVDVAPAMLELDPHGYITAQQAINRAVRSVPFALVYFGAVLTPFLSATALLATNRRHGAVLWLAIALAYLLGVFVLTREINVPINDAVALWNPRLPPAGWQQAREDWNIANLVRCGIACGCFLVALAVPRRAGA